MQINHTIVFDILEFKCLEPDNKHKNEPLEEGDPQVYIISNILDVYIYMGKHTKMELASDSRIICMTQDFEDQEIRL